MKNCIVEITLDENNETSVRIEGHHIEKNICKDCGLYISSDWIKKNMFDKAVLVVGLVNN